MTGPRSLPPAPAEPTRVADIPAAAMTADRLVAAGTLINNNYRIEALVSTGGSDPGGEPGMFEVLLCAMRGERLVYWESI